MAIESMWFIKKENDIHTPWLTMFELETDPYILEQCLGTIFIGCIYGTEQTALNQCKKLNKGTK